MSNISIHRDQIKMRLQLMTMASDLTGQQGLEQTLDAYDRMARRVFGPGPLAVNAEGLGDDLLRVFLQEQCEEAEHSKIQAKEFYEAFVAWCVKRDADQGDIPSMNAVGKMLNLIVDKHFSNVTYYMGLRLRQED